MRAKLKRLISLTTEVDLRPIDMAGFPISLKTHLPGVTFDQMVVEDFYHEGDLDIGADHVPAYVTSTFKSLDKGTFSGVQPFSGCICSTGCTCALGTLHSKVQP